MSGLKLGLLGLDTSHVIVFTQLLNGADHPWHVPGARVIAGYPGGSSDMRASYTRVDGYRDDLRDNYGVAIAESPEEVAERCDAILLTSVDGRAHPELFRRIAPFGKPVFVDKPFATTSADAQAIVDLAERHGVALMSCSSLRYAAGLAETLQAANAEDGAIIGADCCGPTPIEPPMPGLFTYGIHAVEMLYAILGPGCVEVSTRSNDDHDLAVGIWQDGRIGTVRGNRKGNHRFGAVVHREKNSFFADVSAHPKPYYAGLLERVVDMCRTGIEPIARAEMLELIRFIEASNESALTDRPVKL